MEDLSEGDKGEQGDKDLLYRLDKRSGVLDTRPKTLCGNNRWLADACWIEDGNVCEKCCMRKGVKIGVGGSKSSNVKSGEKVGNGISNSSSSKSLEEFMLSIKN